ncbi:MAG: VCBS repeat-containing protein [Acidobacteriia bacterium]|nr:VCBS repeat-containing protein [Terriglobia bacterium]
MKPLHLGIVSAICWLLSVPVAAGQCFATLSKFITIPLATNLSATDFNHDGIPDLAAVEVPGAGGSLSILLGTKQGNFRLPRQRYNLSDAPWIVATGDFNGDGNVDAMTGSETGIDVLLGTGDGTFGSLAHRDVNFAFGFPTAIAFADLNRDGSLDAAIADYSGFRAIFFGQGYGTFIGPFFRLLGAGFSSWAVLAADFNHDGIADLAVVTGKPQPRVAIHLGYGDGTFHPGGSFATGGQDGIAAVLGDFNEDGNLDVAVSDSYTEIEVLFGRGDGTLGGVTRYPVSAPGQIVAGDFNGDGHLDLITTDRVGADLSLLLGNGDGTFQPAIVAATLPGAADHIAVADFNNDGLPDVAFQVLWTGVGVAFNTGTCK